VFKLIKFNLVFGYIRIFLILLLFSFSHLISDTITIYNSKDDLKSLNSNSLEKWFATSHLINPNEYYKNWLDHKEFYEWKEYIVPGDLNSIFPYPWQKGFKVFIKKEIEIVSELSNNDLSIRLGIISDRDKTYFNGELIGSTGKMDSDLPEGYDKLRIYPIPSHLIRLNQKNLILIEIQSFYTSYMGIHQDYLEIGKTYEINSKSNNEEFIKIFICAIYFTLGLTFLFLTFYRSKEKEFLYFCLFLFGFAAYQFLRSQSIYNIHLPFYWHKMIGFSLVPLLFPLLSLFFIHYFKIPYKLYHKLLNRLIYTISFLFLFSKDFLLKDKITISLLVYLYMIYGILYLYWVILKVLHKNKDAKYMLIGVIALIISTALDILSSYSIVILPKSTGIFFLIFILGLAIILGNNLIRMRSIIENYNITLEKEVSKRTTELKKTNSELHEIMIAYKKLASNDFLTGIFNRRSFMELCPPKLDYCKQIQKPISLIMMDIDFFKKINDRYGHSGGDQVLIDFSHRVQSILSEDILFARIGGEEFSIFLPEYNTEETLSFTKRIHDTISTSIVLHETDPNFRYTVSIGFYNKIPNHESLDEFIQKADLSLYRAKSEGRNCTRMFSSP
jgi:diguanylate cyclase (GGDEF)-like protein